MRAVRKGGSALAALAAAVLLLPSLRAQSQPSGTERALDFAFFVRRVVDLDALAVPEEGVRYRQFSSYDRRSRLDPATGRWIDEAANGDSGNYLRIDERTGEAILAEVDGPGAIVRIWSADPKGRIRIYLDGSATPAIDRDFDELFRKEEPPFVRPLIWQRRAEMGGRNPASDCYVPIPFQKGCKVAADRPHGQYYHVGVRLYPPGTRIETFQTTLSEDARRALDDVTGALRRKGADPRPDPSAPVLSRDVLVAPGASELVAELRGQGTIRQLRARLESTERWASRKLLLEIRFDGEAEPSVAIPFGDFFGDPFEGAPYASLPIGITADSAYCYFRMPFGRSARIAVTNEGKRPAKLHFEIASDGSEVAGGSYRFHATWRRDRESRAFDYVLADCRGKGRLAGIALFVDDLAGGWWGEGDEKVFVDGEAFPSSFGTGSEDYFGDAWGIRRFDNALHGCPTRLEGARRQSCYRWHVPDAIPFDRSLLMTIENYAALAPGGPRNDYSSVAYWYGAPGASESATSPRGADRTPAGVVIPGAVEAETAVDIEASGGAASVVTDDDLDPPLSGSAGVRIEGEPGTRAWLRVSVPAEGEYVLRVVARPESSFRLLLDGKPVGPHAHLRKGENRIEVERLAAAGETRRSAILDALTVFPYRGFVTSWWLLAPFDNAGDSGFDRVYPPEAESFARSKIYAGKGGPIRWRKITAADGVVKGETLLEQNEDLVAYAYCEIVSPDARRVTIRLGSDDGVKLWVNGVLVHANHKHRVVKVDEDSCAAELKRGRNALLLKIDQGGGPWGFALRVEDPQGDLESVLPE